MIVKSEITAKTRCYKLQFGQILVFLSYIIPRDVVNTTGFKVSPVVLFDLRSSLGKLFCRDFSSRLSERPDFDFDAFVEV